MDDTRRFLQGMNLPGQDLHHLPDSTTCFRDGALYRVEIPGVENPSALEDVVSTARDLGLTVHRVTAFRGISLLTDREIREMADLGAAQRLEVCLAVGPRSPRSRARGWRLTGADELVHAVEDVRRAVELGIRSVLVADEGLLWVLREMKTSAILPDEVALRASPRLGACNPASVWLLEELGAASYALPSDLSLPRIAAVRAAVDMPLEIAVAPYEAPGSCVRLYDVPELVRVAAPVYLSYDLTDVSGDDTGGHHAWEAAIALCRERVRRARLGQSILERYLPAAGVSARGAEGTAMPVHAA